MVSSFAAAYSCEGGVCMTNVDLLNVLISVTGLIVGVISLVVVLIDKH